MRLNLVLFTSFRFIQSALNEHTYPHLVNRLLLDCCCSGLRLSCSVRINCCFQRWLDLPQNWVANVVQLRSAAH